jgi:hypothetical protein
MRLSLLLLVACGQVAEDVGAACFLAPTTLPGDLEVEVTFGGGEHAPEDALCELQATADGLVLHTSVFYPYDKTPFRDNLISRTTLASCAIAVTEPGGMRITFGDDVFTVDVPGDGEPACPARASP